MVKIFSFIHGIFPRSEKLIKISRDFDRKRTSASQLKKQQDQDRKKLVQKQKDLKLDLVEDGKLDWQDIFRPFVQHAQGMKPGSLTRHFDNNTFFRQPIIRGKIKFNRQQILKYFLKTKDVSKATLPSPFYFSKVAKNQYYQSWRHLITDLTKEFKKLIKGLEKKGFTFIQLNEPCLVYQPVKNKELMVFKKELARLKKGLKIKIGLHTFFGSAAPIFKKLIDFPVDALGLDFFQTCLEDLPQQKIRKGLICGCFNSRSPVIENKTAVSNFIKKVKKRLEPAQIFLTTNSDLEFLTAGLAYKKLAALAKLAKNLNEEN